MKFCTDKYPLGSFKGQKSPGKYIDAWMYKNLELYADKIVNDMTFLGIIYSSTLEVGTGKSVFATQLGEAWTEIINKKHGLDLKFGIDNIVWRPKDLIDKATGNNGFEKLPKYSFILLDEWEDSNYWSELGITLRQFFRKCRQLNLFIVCIIPNWFQLPLAYAVSRSNFAIDVKFNNKLERGFFSFYNFPAKRTLYINGKRNHNYYAAKPTFNGQFPDGYGVPEKEYRKAKLDDLIRYEKENPEKKTIIQREKEIKIKVMKNLMKINKDLSSEEIAKMIGVSTETIRRWKRGDVDDNTDTANNYNNTYNKKEIIVDEERLEREEREKIMENENGQE
jgi:DNA-binding XRE family transcriptional regulator